MGSVSGGRCALLFELVTTKNRFYQVPHCTGDLWDVNLSAVSNDSCSARFSEGTFQEPYVGFVKSVVTTKPVVGVGRFTSPDTMVRPIAEYEEPPMDSAVHDALTDYVARRKEAIEKDRR